MDAGTAKYTECEGPRGVGYDRAVTGDEALALIAEIGLCAPPAATWADLGCGDGLFTRALATLLPEGSTIHAMDRDAAALRRLPPSHDGTRILAHEGDFTDRPWPFGGLDGLLMANALHYVRDQPAFLSACETSLARRRVLLVEYDTDSPSPWVPYPIGRDTAIGLFARAGYASITPLGTRPSIYQRAGMYALLAK
jgi:trans-aconitate methyltransferase